MTLKYIGPGGFEIVERVRFTGVLAKMFPQRDHAPLGDADKGKQVYRASLRKAWKRRKAKRARRN